MGLMAAILVGVIGSLIAAEIYCLLPRISRWVVTRTTRKLPADLRERYSEEWQAYLNEWDGNIGKFCSALGFVWSGRQLLAQWHAERDWCYRSFIKYTYAIAGAMHQNLFLARTMPYGLRVYGLLYSVSLVIVRCPPELREEIFQDFARDVAAPYGCSEYEKDIARMLRITRIVRRAVRRWKS